MAITRVSFAKGGVAGTGSATLTTTPFSAVAGNTIIVLVRTSTITTGSVSSVTDTAGNTYTRIGASTQFAAGLFAYAASNITANASNIVTATMDASHTFCWVAAIQYSGTNLAVTATATSSNVAATDLVTNSFSTAAANEAVLIAGAGNALATYTAVAPFSLIDGSIGSGTSFFGGIEEYLPAPQLTSFVGHITQSVSATYAIMWITIQEITASLLTSAAMFAV